MSSRSDEEIIHELVPGARGIQAPEQGLRTNKYIVTTDRDPAFVTVIRSEREFDAAEQRAKYAELLESRDVLTPRVLKLQRSQVCATDAVLVHEYVGTVDYGTLLASRELSSVEGAHLMSQLGEALGRMHATRLDYFGRSAQQYLVWAQVIEKWMDSVESGLQDYDREAPYGPSRGRVFEAWRKMGVRHRELADEIASVEVPRLVHNDVRMANFLATNTAPIHLAGVVDLDHMMGGDPLNDLAQLMNWFQRDPSRRRLLSYLPSFLEAYKPGTEPWTSRVECLEFYSALYSLSYIASVTRTPARDPGSEVLMSHFDWVEEVLRWRTF